MSDRIAEQIAKMQFYLDSGDEMLVAEAFGVGSCESWVFAVKEGLDSAGQPSR